jgi:Kef-type K+ transport system membrane component KefB
MLSPAQVVAFVLFDLVLILVAARTFGNLAKKVGQPGVVGEIIAGVVLGPSIFGLLVFSQGQIADGGVLAFLSCDVHLVPPPAGGPAPEANLASCLFPAQARAALNMIGQIALLLFMFLVGLELDLDQLKGKGKAVGIVAVGVVGVPVLFGLGLGPILFNDTFVGAGPGGNGVSQLGFSLFIGAFISITALPVMARILQEKKLDTSPLGIVGIAAAAAVTVLMFVLVAIANDVSASAPASTLIRKVGLAAVYIVAMLLVVRPLVDKLLGEPYRKRAQAAGLTSAKMTWSGIDEFTKTGAGHTLTHAMFAWTLVMVFASGWIAHILGINVIVGGFMAGLILPARLGLTKDMTTELFDVVVVILLPVFLAFAGLNADFGQLFANFGDAIVGLLIFLVACVVAKWGGGAVLGRAAGLSWRDSNLLGILMNCRGLLPLVVGLVGLQSGVISPVMNVVGVTMALITTAMTGPLFDRFNKSEPTAKPTAEAVAPG